MTLARWVTGGFFLGIALALSARAVPAFFDAYLDASQTRFDVMTAKPTGDVSYLISYDDYPTLAAIAATESDIVGVNPGNLASIGRVTFADAASPAIERLRRHANTAFMLSATIPLICH